MNFIFLEKNTMNLNRKHFLKSIAATVGVITLMPHTLIQANENKSIFNLIYKIGNTNGEISSFPKVRKMYMNESTRLLEISQKLVNLKLEKLN